MYNTMYEYQRYYDHLIIIMYPIYTTTPCHAYKSALSQSQTGDAYASCPRTAPGTASPLCTSAKKPAGLASIWPTLKPSPESSRPSVASGSPVLKGPVVSLATSSVY